MTTTYIPQRRVDDTVHSGDAPFNHIAEMLVVDVVILLANRTLCAFLQFVLSVSVTPAG